MRLGKLSQKNAEEISRHIDNLLEAYKHDTEVPAGTKAWLRTADRRLISKLAKYDICEEIHDPTVLDFVTRFKEIKNVEETTMDQFEHSERHLRNFFGDMKRLRDVSKQDADNFYNWLLQQKDRRSTKNKNKILGINTVNRRMGRVREIFNEAVEQELITRNPFKKRTISVSVGAAKKKEVSEATIGRVIDHCSTTEWKLLFAFARWIGCRIPSEIRDLTWNNVDWERNAILIKSPKTAHKGRPERLVPIFPEVRMLLERQFDEVDDGTIYVFPVLRNHSCLATTAGKFVEKAKVPKWDKFWNTLRANRETDLMDSHGIRKACAWIGNSPQVALKNYRVQKGSDFDDTERAENKKCTTKRTTHGRDSTSKAEARNNDNLENRNIRNAYRCPNCQAIAEAGLEPFVEYLTKTGFPQEVYNQTYNNDPDIGVVVQVWENLDNATRQHLLWLGRLFSLHQNAVSDSPKPFT